MRFTFPPYGYSPLMLMITHKFFSSVAQPFQAVLIILHRIENLYYQNLLKSTTS
jgi:hypothetical protein